MSTQQALVQAAADREDDLPTTKYAVLPEDVVVIEQSTSGQNGTPAVEVSLAVNLESESNFYVGFNEDLSDGGVFVATHAPRKIGSKVDLVVAAPDPCARGRHRQMGTRVLRSE